MFCAAPPHAEWARWWPNETPPQPSVAPDAGSAAHRHAGDLANVPRSHGLVERVRGAEHRRHAGDLANVPRFHGLVESARVVEHRRHAGDLANVPRVKVLVKRGLASPRQKILHVRDCTHIPPCNKAVRHLRGRRIGAPLAQRVSEVVRVAKHRRGFRGWRSGWLRW
jgi:hypothetical protein